MIQPPGQIDGSGQPSSRPGARPISRRSHVASLALALSESGAGPDSLPLLSLSPRRHGDADPGGSTIAGLIDDRIMLCTVTPSRTMMAPESQSLRLRLGSLLRVSVLLEPRAAHGPGGSRLPVGRAGLLKAPGRRAPGSVGLGLGVTASATWPRCHAGGLSDSEGGAGHASASGRAGVTGSHVAALRTAAHRPGEVRRFGWAHPRGPVPVRVERPQARRARDSEL